MPVEFDPGYTTEPFLTLCKEYPDATVYPSSAFRVEWGPIFHRGRLDGSARVLVIGQDPAQHESVLRRILVGEAGHRVQGLLYKLGIDQSYVFVNAFLYSLWGTIKARYKNDPTIIAYRNRWLDALATKPKLEGVIALGDLADGAWQKWKATPTGQSVNVTYVRVRHPTYPESYSASAGVSLATAMKTMLTSWNAGMQQLAPAIAHPDVARPLVLYGNSLQPGDRVPIPQRDLPAGVPPWMGEEDGWAKRVGTTAKKKRANITTTVPSNYLP